MPLITSYALVYSWIGSNTFLHIQERAIHLTCCLVPLWFFHQVPASDSLVIGDPDHHESAFFKINGLGLEPTDSDSENKPLKNFAKANYEVISANLDIDWDSFLECGVDEGVSRFYAVVNEAIDNNVPDIKVKSDTYPIWYTNELKNFIHEKKELHAIWKESHDLKDYILFSSLRAKCLRLSRELYKIYICDIESKIKKNMKCFWSYVHRFKKGN